jgi:perosamine synthetase
MYDFKVRFSGRAHGYTDAEVAVVVSAMRGAQTLTQGEYLRAFEESFRGYAGVPHAFAVHTATAALELAAELCLLSPGDEVVIPSHTYTSSAYPFAKHGAKLVWADIDRATRVVTVETLERCLTSKTRVIVVPHLYGYCADMPAIMDLARSRGVLVIEDAAQSLGTDVAGVRSGAFADFGVYSFHSHKNITTLGEGGMLAVHDERYAKLVPQLRHNGHCPFPFAQDDYWIPAMSNVDLPELEGRTLMPTNCCLGEVECALGAVLLDRIDTINTEKRRRALAFIDALSDRSELEFHRVEGGRHNYHLLAARLAGGRRDDFIRRMARDHGVQCVVQYYPLNRYDFYRKLGLGMAECPVADDFFDNMVSFPFQHSLTDTELQYVIEATCKVLDAA